MAIKKIINETEHGLQITLTMRRGETPTRAEAHLEAPNDTIERRQINLDPNHSDTVVYGSDANPFLDALDVVMLVDGGVLKHKAFVVERGDVTDDMLNTKHTFKISCSDQNINLTSTNADTQTLTPNKYVVNATGETLRVSVVTRKGETSQTLERLSFELEPHQTRRVQYGNFANNYLLSIAFEGSDGQHEELELSVADQSDDGPYAQNTLVLSFGDAGVTSTQTFRVLAQPGKDDSSN